MYMHMCVYKYVYWPMYMYVNLYLYVYMPRCMLAFAPHSFVCGSSLWGSPYHLVLYLPKPGRSTVSIPTPSSRRRLILAVFNLARSVCTCMYHGIVAFTLESVWSLQTYIVYMYMYSTCTCTCIYVYIHDDCTHVHMYMIVHVLCMLQCPDRTA